MTASITTEGKADGQQQHDLPGGPEYLVQRRIVLYSQVTR